MFEVFVAQIYSSSVFTDLTVGGARYISTGRGFATSRIPFSILYSRFADSSIYMGARLMLILLFGTVAHWQAPLLWFWASLSSLMFSPFIFNPHHPLGKTFSLITETFIRWLSRGNTKWHRNSWIGYIRLSRSRVTGFKRKLTGDVSEKAAGCFKSSQIKHFVCRFPSNFDLHCRSLCCIYLYQCSNRCC